MYTVNTDYVCQVTRKFDLPTMDIKVFDDSKTEVDQEAFEYLIKQPNVTALEIVIPKTAFEDSFSSDSFADAEASSGSDDTVILTRSPSELQQEEEHRLAQMVEDILKENPGGGTRS